MFCDLIGSTQLAHRLDAETLREVVAAYQEHAAGVLRQYEAHIAQYLGDGILVYFGYPKAHEDAAERAVRAGLTILQSLGQLNQRLQREHGIEIAVRIGINTGTVVVGEVGEGQRRETLALGATLHVAARLEGFAETNSMVISDSTRRLVEGLFDLRDMGTPTLKGVEEPVRVYQVLDLRSVQKETTPKRRTPIIGRQREMSRLLGAWTQSTRGRGHTVLISGESGFGKSRLVRALAHHLKTLQDGASQYFWVQGSASTLTRNTAFAPLMLLLEQALEFDPRAPEENLVRVEQMLRKYGLALEQNVPLIAELLSLPLPDTYPPLGLSSALQRQKTMQTLIDWILALSKHRPVVWVLEDLQWCDPSTLEFLGRLAADSAQSHLLLLLTFRDGFEPPWPQPPAQLHLTLERLSTEDARLLIESLTPDPLPPELADHLVDRADGIPLYLEELTKLVLESETYRRSAGGSGEALAELAIPSTLRDSLTARLDRLGEAKMIAQIGAVVGRRFSYRLLQRIAAAEHGLFSHDAAWDDLLHRGLERLIQTQLLFAKGSVPNATYTFKHALIENVAYQSLLRKVRQKLHAQVARLLSDPGFEPSTAQPEVIARHFEGAGMPKESASYLLQAGSEAAERAANAEAVRHLQHAFELLQQLDDDENRQRLELAIQTVLCGALATSRGYGHPDVGRAVARALELFHRFDLDAGAEVQQALMLLWTHHFIRADFDQISELSPRLLARAEREKSAHWIAQADGYVGAWRYFQGDFGRAKQHLDRAIEVYDSHRENITPRANQVEPGVFAHAYRAFVLLLSGRPESGQASCRQAVDLAKRAQHPLSTAFALFMATLYPRVLGDPKQVRPAAAESAAFSGESGFPFYQALTGAVASVTSADETTTGLRIWRGAIAQLEAMGTGLSLPTYFHMLAEVCLEAQQLDEAAATLDKAFELAAKTDQHYADAELHRIYGQLLNAQGENERSEEHFRRAIDIAHQQGALLYELRAALNLAQGWRKRGLVDEVRQLLEPICARFVEGLEAPDMLAARALLEER